jgi:cell division protein FtsB
MGRWKLSQINTILYLILILSMIWVSYIIVWGKGGLVERKNLENQILSLEEEVHRLKLQEELLDIHIRNLKENRKYIEGYARELGYKKEGEVIFKFVQKNEGYIAK